MYPCEKHKLIFSDGVDVNTFFFDSKTLCHRYPFAENLCAKTNDTGSRAARIFLL